MSGQTNQTAKKEFTLTVTSKAELVEQVKGFSDDMYLWQLAHLLHGEQNFRLTAADADGKIAFRFNELCGTKTAVSRLENFTRSLMLRLSNVDWHNIGWSIAQRDPLPLGDKCPRCTEAMGFCAPKMNAYIQFACKKLGIAPDEVYRDILQENYQPKVDLIDPVKTSAVPVQEYVFIDPVSAAAAAQLLNLRLIRMTPSLTDRIAYNYVPLCEKSKNSFVAPVFDFYRQGTGKHDFLKCGDWENQIARKRSCADCMFTQCPDKVAAYLSWLARRYGEDPVELALHILKVNRQGMSANGYFNLQERMHELDEIPLTPDSYKTIRSVTTFIINKFYVENNVVPFIPVNVAIFTRDELLADKLALILKNFLHFYKYWDKNPVLKEYRFSQAGLNGLIETISKVTEPTILHVKEMELIASVAANPQENIQLKMTRLTNLIKEKNDKVFVFVSGEKNKLDAALSLYNDFYIGLLSHKLTIADMPAVKIVQAIVGELRDQFELEDGFEAALESYVLDKYGESDLKSRGFIDLVKQTIIFNHFNTQINIAGKLLVSDIPAAGNRRSREEIWKELNSLAGLDSVKREVFSIEQLLSFRQKTADLGLKAMPKPNMHMVFAGNPGTGKTTVARIIAEMLYNIGYIKQNKLIEVSPKDLVGMYIGHTAPKTAAVCESAYDGVLFIDEAYELTVAGTDGTSRFRSECITELIKQMEDNRDRLIVIFAGYTAEMREFLESNAGFASRIGKFIEFKDYDTDELAAMFIRQAYNNGMSVSEKALLRVMEKIDAARQQPHFGNGRYARNLFEKVLLEHAKNTFSTNDPDRLMVITEDDVPADC